MLVSYGVGLAGVALVMAAWLGVQVAWRRAFPEASADPDALAGRLGCHGREHCGGCAGDECRGGGRAGAAAGEEERS